MRMIFQSFGSVPQMEGAIAHLVSFILHCQVDALCHTDWIVLATQTTEIPLK